MTSTGHSRFPIYLRRAEDVASLVRARRIEIGLTQQALADRLTVSRKWVNEIEQGNANAKLELVLRAINELGIDLYGHAPTGSEPDPACQSVNGIDVDAIAEMGLPRRRK
jgi:HTH-type transcriptional regulator/antitoxin HipB